MNDEDERLVRIESRLVQLGDHVGANLRTKQRIDILPIAGGASVKVEVDSMNVSIWRITDELKRHQIQQTAVGVWLEGRLVATVYPKAVAFQPTRK